MVALVRERRRQTHREQALTLVALAQTRDRLLAALVDVAPLEIVRCSSERRDRPKTADEKEQEFVATIAALESAPDQRRRQIYQRKSLCIARDLELTGREIRSLAARLLDPRSEHGVLLRAESRLTSLLVVDNQRLIFSAIPTYPIAHLSQEDLLQEGSLGLLRALDKYDIRRGSALSTYALWWIKQSLSRAIQIRERVIHIPVHVHALMEHIRQFSKEYETRTGIRPPPKVVAAALNAKQSAVETALRLLETSDAAFILDAPVEGNDGLVLGDIVPDPRPSPLESAITREVSEAVHDVIRGLKTERQRVIMRLRFGIDCSHEHTLEEIGGQMGVTRERIRQIEAKVLLQLRKLGLSKDWSEMLGHNPLAKDESQSPPAELEDAVTFVDSGLSPETDSAC